jgi:uncharacterized protein (TIGR03435 family)
MSGIAFLLLSAAAAQQPASAPRFEVVSIKTVPPNTPPTMREMSFTPVLPGGQYSDVRATLFSMVAFAYNVQDPSTQLFGLPKWAESESYAVMAKPAEGFPVLSPADNREQVRQMLRAMLEDRFHLQLHTEMRDERVYQLEIAKGGLRIKETDAPEPTAQAGPVEAAMGNGSGRIIGKKATADGIARCLTVFLKRPVVDRTGLKGYYDFDVRWKAPETADGPPAPGLGAEGIALLISNLESLLGLHLGNIVAPVQFWVVDRADPPSAN